MPCTCGQSWSTSLGPVAKDPYSHLHSPLQQGPHSERQGTPPGAMRRCDEERHSSKNISEPAASLLVYSSRETNGCSSCSIRGVCRVSTTTRRVIATSFLIVGLAVVVIFLTFVALAVLTISRDHSRLVDRVSSLEKELSALSTSCCSDVHCGSVRQPQAVDSGDKRINKFAFLMTQNAVPGSSDNQELDSSQEHEGHGADGPSDMLINKRSPRNRPIKHIRLGDFRTEILTEPLGSQPPPEEDDDRQTRRSSDKRTSDRASSLTGIALERFRRKAKVRGRKKANRSESRGRTLPIFDGNGTSHEDPVVHEVRGVHFQANLNRTTTIGVAGWMPHWSLSRSLDSSSGMGDAILRKFRLNPRGNVTVVDPGLYYVYSQMMYYDPSDYIGHSIVINGVEAFTCIAPIAQRTNKYKTCFIGGLAYVPGGAKVGVRMLYTPRQVCLFEDTSYFGMFRVT